MPFAASASESRRLLDRGAPGPSKRSGPAEQKNPANTPIAVSMPNAHPRSMLNTIATATAAVQEPRDRRGRQGAGARPAGHRVAGAFPVGIRARLGLLHCAAFGHRSIVGRCLGL